MKAPPVTAILPSVVRLVRPKQWAKNVLVFAALLFTGGALEPGAWLRAVAAFVAMCLVSSGTYVFNDLVDVERDRRHPVKRSRPLASGAISRAMGVAVGLLLLALGIGTALALGTGVFGTVLIYLAIQVAYNTRLKRVAVADVFTIAAGFVLRAILGAAAIGVGISGWLLFCTGGLALMLGFAKRRNEYILQGDDRSASRESLVHYSRPALDALVVVFAGVSAMCYGLYCLQSGTAHRFPALILTAPFVFYGICRYTLIVFSLNEGGEPADVLFKDRHIIASVVLFVAAALLAMSGLRLPLVER